jgi:hypothetical protein
MASCEGRFGGKARRGRVIVVSTLAVTLSRSTVQSSNTDSRGAFPVVGRKRTGSSSGELAGMADWKVGAVNQS